jgi:predicted nucleic acid-binding protein
VGAAAAGYCGVRRIVSDTGPLLHLHEAACLALLERAGTVTVPQAVDSEMVQHVRDWHTRKPPWITVTAVIAPYNGQATGWQQSGLLETGEAEAIALALQLSATWLLTDDTRLAHSSLWISARVLTEARAALDRLFP